MKHLVAVYGSLRAGMGNHRLLERHNARLVTEGEVVSDSFTMVDYAGGGFPAIVPDKNAEVPITVEVYEVDDAGMSALDMLEGYPSFYNRKRVDLEEVGNVWIYYIQDLNVDLYPIVTNGDWVMYYNDLHS